MNKIKNNLDAAISTMRNAVDQAERKAKTGDALAVSSVLQALSWGFANASNSIECAMAALEEKHEQDLMNLR